MSQIITAASDCLQKGPTAGDEGKPELSMSELINALANREFFFHHQPIIDMVSGIQVGSEMLIRWVRKGAVLAPMWFMPMIEHHNLVGDLDHFVLSRFAEIPWAETVKPDMKYRVFMNVSAQSFMDEGFTKKVQCTNAEMQKNNVIMVLELTERNGCEFSFITRQMHGLRDEGVEIALDDFGVGYSSLSRLIELPVNILKIDRAIIDHISRSTRAEHIIATVFELAKKLNLRVIAEGVETQAQANWLVQLGECWAQGFYFARPSVSGYQSQPHVKIDKSTSPNIDAPQQGGERPWI